MWVVIAHPYLNPSIALSKPPLRLGRTWWTLWMSKLWLHCNNLITSKSRINLKTNLNPNLFQYQIKFECLIIARFFEVSKANHRLKGCQRNLKSCVDINGYPRQELFGTNSCRRSECLAPTKFYRAICTCMSLTLGCESLITTVLFDGIYSSLGIVPLTNTFTYIENWIEIKLLKTILATDLLKPISKPHIRSIALGQ